MNVFAVIKQDWDGIQEIELFQSEHAAKTRCRALNKQSGFNNYEVKKMEVKS